MKAKYVLKRVGLVFSCAVMCVSILTACGKTGSEGQSKEEAVVSESGEEKAAEEAEAEKITDDQALEAVKKYCYDTNSDLEDIVNEGEHQVSWKVESSDESTIVILFTSYTGAEVRYYIDPASGDTYETEFVSGIMKEEEKTDVSFNIKDYIE